MIDSLTRPFRAKSVDDIYINISHFLDHFIMLIFAKAAYDAGRHFGFSYDEIIVYGAVGFLLFGGMAPIAAQLADRFSRSLLMVIFHFGIGLGAILAGLSQNIYHLAAAIGVIGVFAAIYHPVGIAMLVKSNKKIGYRLGVNGVFGNMGVAAAPLITGLLLTVGDWRICFILPGLFCFAYGVAFAKSLKIDKDGPAKPRISAADSFAPNWRRALAALALSTASGGFIFGAMTFVVPRYFEISMTNISTSVAITGLLASIVYAIASFSQIAVGWLIDRYSAKNVLFVMAVGQVLFIYLAAQFNDLALFVGDAFGNEFCFRPNSDHGCNIVALCSRCLARPCFQCEIFAESFNWCQRFASLRIDPASWFYHDNAVQLDECGCHFDCSGSDYSAATAKRPTA
jgi:MFS family permease